MDDGGCAVLVSQHPSTKFSSFDTHQGWLASHGMQDYPESQQTLPVYYNSHFSWPSVRLYEMEARERKQHSTITSTVDDSTSRSSSTMRHTMQGQEVQTIASLHCVAPHYLEMEDFSSDHSLQTCNGRELGESTLEHLANQLPSSWEPKLAAFETNGPYWTDAGYTAEGRDADISYKGQHAARIPWKESSTSDWHDRDSASHDLRTTGGRARNENAHIQSHICGSSDSNHKQNETWYHYPEKNSEGDKQYYNSMGKVYGGKVSSGPFEDFNWFGASKIHEKDHDMNGNTRSQDRDADTRIGPERNYQERKYADGRGSRFNAFDGLCSLTCSYNLHVKRTSAGAYERRYQVGENGRPEFDSCKRYSTDNDTKEWEGDTSSDKLLMDNSQGCDQPWSLYGRSYRQESRLVVQSVADNISNREYATADDIDDLGLAVGEASMGLPAVFENVSRRKCEAHLSSQKYDAFKLTENFHGPSQPDVSRQRLEDASQQSDHIAVSYQDLPPITQQAVPSGPFCLNGREEQNNVTFDQIPPLDDLQINERVQRLMDGFILVPGQEKEVISEALSHAASCMLEDNDIDFDSEESPRFQTCLAPHWRYDQLSYRTNILDSLEVGLQELEQPVVMAIPNDQIGGHVNGYQSTRKWTSRGGDWKLLWQSGTASATWAQANAHTDRVCRLKTVLNKGSPLCETRHCGLLDPRREHIKYKAFHKRKLKLPQWAYCSNMQSEYVLQYSPECVPEVVKTMETQPQCYQPFVATPKSQASTPLLPCHLQTSFGLSRDSRKIKPGKAMQSTRLTSQQAERNCLGPLLTDSLLLKCDSESDCRALTRGFAVEKQAQDTKSNYSASLSAFPLNSLPLTESAISHENLAEQQYKKEDLKLHDEDFSLYSKQLCSQKLSQFNQNQQLKQRSTLCNINDSFSFHQFYEQFIRYIHGRLHEHVMKSYKSRDFAAILHEGLDKKLNNKKHEKIIEGSSLCALVPSGSSCGPLQVSSYSPSGRSLDTRCDEYNLKSKNGEVMDYVSSTFCSPGSSSSRCELNMHSETVGIDYSDQPKRRCIYKKKWLIDVEARHDCGLQQPCHSSCMLNDAKGIIYSLESDLETGSEKCLNSADFEKPSWMALDPRILMRVFHCLFDDVKSLMVASATCKSWRTCFENFMKDVTYIDLSSLGSLCTDAVLNSLTGSARQQIRRLFLRHCTAISASTLRSLLEECPNMSLVDISGCELLTGLAQEFRFRHIKWIGCGFHVPRQKTKSLNLICGRNISSNKVVDGLLSTNSSDDLAHKDRLVDEQAHTEDTESKELDSSCLVDQDSDISQIALPVYRLKHSRLNIAGKLKEDSDSCQRLAGRVHAIADNDSGRTLGQRRKHKQVHEYKLRTAASNCFPSDKIAPCKSKLELLTAKCSDSRDTVKSADKYICHQMAQILKMVKEADTKKLFSNQVPYGKGPMSLTRRVLDFSAIEEKWKAQHYAGSMDGLNSFKNDLFLVFRSAFHSGQKGSPLFRVAEDIFKLAHRLVRKLEETVNKVHTERHLFSNGSKSFKGKPQYNQSVAGRFQIGKKWTDLKRKTGMNKSNADGENKDNHLEEEGDGRFRRKKQRKSWKMSALEDEEEADESELDIETESEGEDTASCENGDSSTDECSCSDMSNRQWGARMTKASMVPPVTRKYDVIEEYVPVIDEEEVIRKMKLELPEDYGEKLRSVRGEYSHLEIPELKDYKPRKKLGDEVLEQEVYGIDPYTYNLLLDTMATEREDFTDSERQQLIEEDLLCALNEEVKKTTGTGKAHMTYPLGPVVQRLIDVAKDHSTKTFCQSLLRNMQSRQKEKYVAYRKGLGVVCNKQDGFEKDDFVVEFFGEVYPAWRWFEKQDAIRLIQKKEKDPAPEFYNIFLERPKGDAAGYDLVVVDAMHKANYASRICHSCRPNCEAKVTAVDGQYQIGLYTLRSIQYGEELTFDYNSVTESKEEYEASICLCGSQRCRGSYQHLAGPETFQQVIKEKHGLLDRHHLLLEACYAGPPTRVDTHDLRQAGLGSCLLEGLPDWTVCYAARLVRFINHERNWLPKKIIKNFVKERQLETNGDQELFEAEVQADGVYNQRLQNLAITLDKVRYVLRKAYGDPGNAPPPLRKLEPAEVVSLIWKGENSVVGELLCSMESHLSKDDFTKFKCKVHEHEPVDSGSLKENIHESLVWLRDELRKLPATCLSRHDAAADIIHMYAYTKHFFTNQDYRSFQSPPITINSLDLGPKYAHLLGSDSHESKKTYGKDYVLGQLIFWYKQNVADPGSSLAKAQRGCLVLPDLSSCYTKSLHQDPRIVYGSRIRRDMLHRMEQQPQRQWPNQGLWEFKNRQRLFGSPIMDAIRKKSYVNREIIDWLKNRPITFRGPRDHFV